MRSFHRFLALALVPWLCGTAVWGSVIPRPAPPLTVRMPDGQSVSLQSLRGKVVLLEFFLTACPHCQRAVPVIEAIYEQWRSRGLEVLAIAINPDAPQFVPAFRQRFGATYPIALGDGVLLRSFAETPATAKQPPFVPHVFVIDRRSVIRYEHPGNDSAFWGNQNANMRAELDALLREPSGAPKTTVNPNKKG